VEARAEARARQLSAGSGCGACSPMMAPRVASMIAVFVSAALAADECVCKTLPCVYDAGCADPGTDRLGGLGCNAEGSALCRFEIMDCDGPNGNSETKQACAEHPPCAQPGYPGVGCNALGIKTLRFCGFGEFAANICPRNALPSEAGEKGVPEAAEWKW